VRIALQTDKPLISAGRADAVYMGERFCVKRFMRLFDKFAEYAADCPIPVNLLTPFYVRESELDFLVKKTASSIGVFSGVHVADIGFARKLKGIAEVTYVGPVYNEHALEMLIQKAGIGRLQLAPPRVHLMEKIIGRLPLETVVHGQLPLSSTPRCLVEMRLGSCARCDEVFTVHGQPENLALRGNVLYSTNPIAAFGLIGQFAALGFETIIIECFNMDESDIAEITAIYKGEQKPPNDEVSGAFFTDENDMLDGVPWRRRISQTDTSL
jgi:hypothetical protein